MAPAEAEGCRLSRKDIPMSTIALTLINRARENRLAALASRQAQDHSQSA